MRRACEIALLLADLVAVQAARASVGRGHSLETEDLGFVATALDVCLARAMARFAAVPLRPPLRVQRGDKMRRSLVVLIEILRRHVLVTCLAGLCADV